MIGYVKGNLVYAEKDTVILETGGVGYEIICSSSAFSMLVSNNGGEVFVYTAVKEDGITLFGFKDVHEKSLFLKLITVSGIGPKGAITILSAIKKEELINAIARGDVKALSSIKGLGKKTAERIIVELGEKFNSDGLDLSVSDKENLEEKYNDAIEALASLGFSKTESSNAVKQAVKNGASSVKEAINIALKSMR